jgi:hypothetical protein
MTSKNIQPLRLCCPEITTAAFCKLEEAVFTAILTVAHDCEIDVDFAFWLAIGQLVEDHNKKNGSHAEVKLTHAVTNS